MALLALILALGGCHTEVRPELPKTPTLDTDSVAARGYGERLGLGVAHRARGRTAAVIESVPAPARSRFPGLTAPQVRRSLTRGEPGDGPVILLMLDTTRADRLSAYGHSRPTTPALEALAAQGVTLSRFYVNAAWTRPSVASIMTSRYRRDHGTEVAQASLPGELTTIAELFASNGFATGAVIGNQTVRGVFNFNQGFDTYLDPRDEIGLDPHASVLVDHAIEWIDDREDDRWFLWLFLVDPHDPYAPEKEFDLWRDGYKGAVPGVPKAEYTSFLPKGAFRDRMLSLYDGEIRQMDAAIGRLFAHLKAKGLWEESTILVVGDHGEAFGENNCYRHPYHMWEPNLNVPMIVKSPVLAGAAGMVEERLFHGVDVAPTLVDLAGLEAEDWTTPGQSLAATMEGPISQGWERAVYAEIDGYGIRRSMVRQGRWKFMRFEPTNYYALQNIWPQSWEELPSAKHRDLREYLFDVEEDPEETTNQVTLRPELADELRARLDAFHEGEVHQDDIADVPEELLEDLRSLGYVE